MIQGENIYFLIKMYIVVTIMTVQELLYKHYYQNRKMETDEEENIKGDVVIVTGASRGMGAEISEQFAKRGAIVVLGCIDLKEGEETVKNIKAKTGNENVEMIYLDLGDLASVQKFAAEINGKYPKIRILVNNAGIAGLTAEKQIKTKDGFNITMAVNYFGHFLLTNLLLENLKGGKPSRIVSMSSTAQLLHKLDLNDINMDKSGFGTLDYLPYNNSKYAISLFTRELGNQTRGTGITTYALCPGGVKTTIFKDATPLVKIASNFFYILLGFTAEQAASEFILYHAISKRVAYETGITYRFKKHFTRANNNLKDSIAKELWDVSADLVQLEKRLKAHQIYHNNKILHKENS